MPKTTLCGPWVSIFIWFDHFGSNEISQRLSSQKNNAVPFIELIFYFPKNLNNSLPARMHVKVVYGDSNFFGVIDMEAALANNDPHVAHRIRSVERSIISPLPKFTENLYAIVSKQSWSHHFAGTNSIQSSLNFLKGT